MTPLHFYFVCTADQLDRVRTQGLSPAGMRGDQDLLHVMESPWLPSHINAPPRDVDDRIFEVRLADEQVDHGLFVDEVMLPDAFSADAGDTTARWEALGRRDALKWAGKAYVALPISPACLTELQPRPAAVCVAVEGADDAERERHG